MLESPEVPVSFEKQQKVNFYCVRVIFFISLSSAAYGYAASVIATTLTQPSFHKHMHLDTAPNAASLIGAIMGLYFAGGIVGAVFGGWISKAFGRKISVASGLLLILVSGALLTASVNATMFIVFRFFNGWGSVLSYLGTPFLTDKASSGASRSLLAYPCGWPSWRRLRHVEF